MIKNLLILVLAVNFSFCFGQNSINTKLKHQLDSISIQDQLYRNTIDLLFDSISKDSIAKVFDVAPSEIEDYIWKIQMKIDSSNLVFIEKTIYQYGYPGKTLVGDSSNEVAWLVIQHSNKKKIAEYLPLMKKAGKHQEIPYNLACMMEDRHRMTIYKKQKYGTQATFRKLKNGTQEFFIWPIRGASRVNKRRLGAGFDSSVEESALRMGVKYRVVKMREIHKLNNK